MSININRLEKLAHEKDDENWDFRIFVKGHNPKQIDKLVSQFYKKHADEIDCLECGNCCKSLNPNLTKEEVNIIRDDLGISFEEFTDRYTGNRAVEGYYLKDEEKGICPFLQEDDNKCSIYDIRSQPCRSFPHLDKDGFNHRVIAMIDNCYICPIVYNVIEDLKEELGYIYEN